MANSIVSIIVPIYNTYEFLEECLQSIISQTYKNIEIILIDDGSTDNSDQICKRYIEKYTNIKYIYQTNQGVSVARNRGINEANGEYIYFLDSDDKIENTFIENSIKCAKENNADFVIVACNVMNKNLKTMIGAPWEVFVRKNILDEYNIRYTPGLSYGEDGLFVHKLQCVATKVCVCKNAVYYYRERAGQVTQKKKDPKIALQYINIILNELEQFYSKYNLFEVKRLFLYIYLIRVPYCWYLDVDFSEMQREEVFNMLYKFREKHNLLDNISPQSRYMSLSRKLMTWKLLQCKNYKQYEKYISLINIYRKLKKMIGIKAFFKYNLNKG